MIFMILSTPFFLSAATYYVAPDGNDNNQGTSWDFPFATVEKAVSTASAQPDNEVVISNGTYFINLVAEIQLKNGLVCRGVTGDPQDVLLIGSNVTRGFRILEGTLASLTISNCVVPQTDGGAIYCSSPLSIVSNCLITACVGKNGGGIYTYGGGAVTDCQIINNRATGEGGGCRLGGGTEFSRNLVRNNCSGDGSGGGGVYLSGGVIMDDCDIIGNFTTNAAGGGIYASSLSSAVSNCRIVSNSVFASLAGHGGAGTYARGDVYSNCVFAFNQLVGVDFSNTTGGGGSFVYSASKPSFYNCLFYKNQAKYGGGIYLGNNSEATLVNCTIINNTAGFQGGGIYFRSGTDSIINCILYGNHAIDDLASSNYFFQPAAAPLFSYSCIAPALDGKYDAGNNVFLDPLLTDLENGLYQLLQESPCINAGLNNPDWMPAALDLAGHRRLDRVSGRVDIGCYEYIPPCTIFTIK